MLTHTRFKSMTSTLWQLFLIMRQRQQLVFDISGILTEVPYSMTINFISWFFLRTAWSVELIEIYDF